MYSRKKTGSELRSTPDIDNDLRKRLLEKAMQVPFQKKRDKYELNCFVAIVFCILTLEESTFKTFNIEILLALA